MTVSCSVKVVGTAVLLPFVRNTHCPRKTYGVASSSAGLSKRLILHLLN